MRLLGDKYVKSEFRQHKQAEPEFVKNFLQQWTQYADTLSTQRPSTAMSTSDASEKSLGVDLENEVVENMSEEQQLQLQRLRVEAQRVRKELKK